MGQGEQAGYTGERNPRGGDLRFVFGLFPVKDKAGLLAELREQTPRFRGELGNRIRHQVRKIPELEFFDDDSLDYIEAIDRELRGEGENPIRK